MSSESFSGVLSGKPVIAISSVLQPSIRTQVAIAPQDGRLHYSLALVLGEQEKFQEAVEEFRRADELLPASPTLQINLGGALQRLGLLTEAEAELLEAYALAPLDLRVLQALIGFYGEASKWQKALGYAKVMADLLPEDRRVAQMLQHIEQRVYLRKQSK